MGDAHIPAREIGEVLDIVSAKVPKLVKEIVATLYSEEAASQIGKAVGTFYKELIDSGIKPAEATEMTRSYLNTLKSLSPQNYIDYGEKHVQKDN